MKFVDLTLSRFIPGRPAEVFDVWFDPASPGGPWYGAEKTIMNLAIDGMFYFGIERETLEQKGIVESGRRHEGGWASLLARVEQHFAGKR